MRAAAAALSFASLFAVPSCGVSAATIAADPSNYLARLHDLKPGDVLALAPGTYLGGLPLHGVHGRAGAPITVSGAGDGRTVFLAQPGVNTVSIKNAAFLVIRALTLDGMNRPVDAVKAEGTARYAHDITLERLTILRYGANQQIVGISTKCPAWHWVIRDNVIIGAGTGIYLGQSDGSAPFVAGVIENNYIADTTGYDMEIKYQAERANLPGMPRHAAATIIRHNVFSKASGGASGRMARPNVLLGRFPAYGAGAEDWYFVYGNFFYGNPHESLFQANGNVAAYANIFLNSRCDAVRIEAHNGVPRRIVFDHNTVIARGAGVSVSGGDRLFRQVVRNNLVFAAAPISGGEQSGNLVASYSSAATYLTAPFAGNGRWNFAPTSKARRPSAAASRDERGFPGWTDDFFGRPRRNDFVGAVNPGAPAWQLPLAPQPLLR